MTNHAKRQWNLVSQVNVVLFLLSIVQGLAFTRLVDNFIPFVEGFRMDQDNLLVLVNFILCFAILIRVFQTYLAALLDYEKLEVFLMDIIGLLFIGAFEYWLFSYLKSPYKWPGFYKLASFFGVFSTLMYTAALMRVRKDHKLFSDNPEKHRSEIILQRWNVSLSLAFTILSLGIILYSGKLPQHWILILSLILAALIIYNTAYSWIRTITPIESKRIEAFPGSPGPALQTPGKLPSSDIGEPVSAEIPDVPEITQLLLNHFGYVAASIFDTSERLSTRIISRTMVFMNGQHFLGYRNFHVIRDNGSDKKARVVALLALKTRTSGYSIRNFLAFSYLCLIVLLNLGIMGFARYFRNLLRNRRARPEFTAEDLYISYIAVDPAFQHTGIGRHLVHFARERAVQLEKSAIKLDVRQSNTQGMQFFHKQGFQPLEILYDNAFGASPRVVMMMKL